jgi:hypothetical protein
MGLLFAEPEMARMLRRGKGRGAASQADVGEEIRQIVGMVVDVGMVLALGRDMDGAHPHRVRRGEVAGVVLEHRAAGGVEPVGREDRLEGRAFGLGAEARVLDPVDGVEEAVEPRAASTRSA